MYFIVPLRHCRRPLYSYINWCGWQWVSSKQTVFQKPATHINMYNKNCMYPSVNCMYCKFPWINDSWFIMCWSWHSLSQSHLTCCMYHCCSYKVWWPQHAVGVGPLWPVWEVRGPEEGNGGLPDHLETTAERGRWTLHAAGSRYDQGVKMCFIITVLCLYDTCQFYTKSSQKKAHSSPKRVKYGVSFVSWKYGLCSNLLIAVRYSFLTLGLFGRRVIVVTCVCPSVCLSVCPSVCLSVPIILVNTITQSVYPISPPNLLGGFNMALSWMVL